MTHSVPAASEQPLLIGRRYRLLTPIGRGGMGIVWRAHDQLTGETVALKQISMTLPDTTRKLDLRWMLAQEFRTLASLRHPNIIGVRDYGFVGDSPYYTMDLVEPVQTLIQAGADEPLPVRLSLIVQVLHALVYLHRRGIVHRDLKPGNVLVNERRVRVVDFGLAKQRGYLNTDQVAGTLAYAAPEVLQGHPVSEASDLYAVGVLAYELLAGRHPFARHEMTLLVQQVMTQPPDLNALPVEPPLRDIVGRLLMKSPSERYRNAQAVLADLADFVPLGDAQAAQRDSILQAAQFVGRTTELATLRQALAATISAPDAPSSAARGTAWLIGGESGVGKSRLMDELRVMALVDGALVLHGQSVQGGAMPYQMWRAPLRRLLLAVEISPDEAAVLAEVVPDVTALTGVIPAVPPLVDGRTRQQRLTLTIADIFRRCPEPVVLLLDDLHWVTAASLEPLKQLLRIVREVPLMIVGTYRDDERQELPRELPGMTLLRLERLPEDDMRVLCRALLGERGDSPALMDLMRRETEGNALFIMEVVRALADEVGSLDRIGADTLPIQVFAGGVVEVIRRRLERLPAEAREPLRAAAVIGRVLDLRLLRALAAGIDVERWLLQCSEAAVLEVHNERWRFTHDKLRDAVLAELDDSALAALHQRVAEAIERVYPDDQSRALPLAEHWYAAGVDEKIIDYALIVGDQAHDLSNYLDGRLWLERALRLLPRTTDPRRMRALLRLGDVLTRLSDYDEAINSYTVSITIARLLRDTEVEADALNGLGFASYLISSFDDAYQYSKKALALAEANGSPRQAARALNNLAILAEHSGDYETASAYATDALESFNRLGDMRGAASALNNLGSFADTLGDLPAAQAYYEDSLRLCRQIGYRHGVGVLLNNLGIIAERQGDYPAAWTHYEQSAELSRMMGSRRTLAYTLANRAFVGLRLGRREDSRYSLSEAVLLARELNDNAIIPHLLAGAAEYYRTGGRLELAAKITGLVAALPDPNPDFVVLRLDPLQAAVEAEFTLEAYGELVQRGLELDIIAILNHFASA